MRAAFRAGLLTPRLIASLLMVDFANPLFSMRRSALFRHLIEVAWTGDGVQYSEAVAAAVLNSPEANIEDSPEAEFAQNWATGDDFTLAFSERLNAFYASLESLLASTGGFAQIHELAESRRESVKKLPIFESRMLFATSSASSAIRIMTASATVEEVS